MIRSDSAVSALRADTKCVAGEVTGKDLFCALSYISEDAVTDAWETLESRSKKYRNRQILFRVFIILIALACVFAAASIAYPHIRYMFSKNKYQGDIGARVAVSVLDESSLSLRTQAIVRDEAHLNIGELYDGDYIPLYGYSSVSSPSVKDYKNKMLSALINALGADTDAESLVPDEIGYYHIGKYTIYINRTDVYDKTVLKDDYHLVPRIVLDGKSISVAADATDEQIIKSLSTARQILFESFGVSFNDVKILRFCKNHAYDNSETPDNTLTVVFYNEDDHLLNRYGIDGVNCGYHHLHTGVVSDNIAIQFEYSDTDDVIYAKRVEYTAYNSVLEQVLTAEKISLGEAEAMAASGLAYFAHSCRFCPEGTPDLSFEKYDYVELQYSKATEHTPALPFYVFYKYTGDTDDGKKIYNLAYVPAIEISGYEEYFSSLTESHVKAGNGGDLLSKAEINEILSAMELYAFDVADGTASYSGELLAEYQPWSAEGLEPYYDYSRTANKQITFLGETFECAYQISYRKLYFPGSVDKYAFDGGYFELNGNSDMVVGVYFDDPADGIKVENEFSVVSGYMNNQDDYARDWYALDDDDYRNRVRYVYYRLGSRNSDYIYVDMYGHNIMYGFFRSNVGAFANLDPAIQKRLYALRSERAEELVKRKIDSVCEGYSFYGFHPPMSVVLEDGTVTLLYRVDVTYPNGETRQVNIIFK